MAGAAQSAVQGAVSPVGYPALGFLPRALIPKYKEFFVYDVIFNTIGATSTTTQSTNVQADSDFVCMMQTATITDAAGTTFTAIAAAPLLVSILDAGSGKITSDNPVHINNWFGTGIQPFLLMPVPKFYRRNGQIQVQLQNQGASALVVRLSFIGFKVYDVPA